MAWFIAEIIFILWSLVALVTGAIRGDFDLQVLGIGMALIAIAYATFLRTLNKKE